VSSFVVKAAFGQTARARVEVPQLGRASCLTVDHRDSCKGEHERRLQVQAWLQSTAAATSIYQDVVGRGRVIVHAGEEGGAPSLSWRERY